MLEMFMGTAIIIFIWFSPKLLGPTVQRIWQRFQYKRWLKSSMVQSRLSLLNQVYAPINGHQISKTVRDDNALTDRSFVYGEIKYISFIGLLDLVNIPSDGTFYDLGSGVGKAVLTAALFGNFKTVIGVELLAPLHKESLRAMNQLLKHIESDPLAFQYPTKIKFYHDDICKMDFSDASLIFVNATCYSDALWETLQDKFEQLAEGTVIIIVSRQLFSTQFILRQQLSVDMSWGAASVAIYQRATSST